MDIQSQGRAQTASPFGSPRLLQPGTPRDAASTACARSVSVSRGSGYGFPVLTTLFMPREGWRKQVGAQRQHRQDRPDSEALEQDSRYGRAGAVTVIVPFYYGLVGIRVSPIPSPGSKRVSDRTNGRASKRRCIPSVARRKNPQIALTMRFLPQITHARHHAIASPSTTRQIQPS